MGVYEHDHSLPRLPIPPLEETAAELRRRIRPITNDEEFNAFSKELEAFCAKGGAGVRLHERLLDWQASLPGNSSWLRPFWDESYIGYRESLPRNLHYTLQLRGDKWAPGALARLSSALAYCISGIRHETLPPEKGRNYNSMDTIAGLVSTRIPVPARDMWYYPHLSTPMTAAVVCEGHWFILSLTDQSGTVLPPETLHEAYEKIRAEAKAMPPAIGVSAFTSTDREDASLLRTRLSAYMLNRLNLEKIEKTCFVVCLEDDDMDEVAFGRSVLMGDAPNRFYDKSVQIISSGEKLGVSLEHSGCDGMMWSYVLERADECIQGGTGRYADAATAAPAHIQKLEWVVIDVLEDTLREVVADHASWERSMFFDQGRIKAINKPAIKRMGCSPDAVVQLLFQLAYYRHTGAFRSFYEAVSAREFYGGRTECIRSCTEESAAFIRGLEAGEPKETLRAKLDAATKTHGADINRAKSGMGCERHLSGLQAIHQMYFPDEPLPALFNTVGVRLLKHDHLSTSSIPGSAIDYFAFVPVVLDGLGVGYALYDDALHVAVSSYEESGVSPTAYLKTLEEAGKELLEMFTELR